MIRKFRDITAAVVIRMLPDETEGPDMTFHIMIVDDDSTNLMTAGHILRRNDMRVTALSSGKELLARIRQHELPDLILLDIKMPEMDGFETLKQLRAIEKEHGTGEIPVVFLTADETADTENQGLAAGVSDYIRKPFDPNILLRRVHNIVSKEKRLNTLRTEADTDKLTGFLNKAAYARAASSLCSSDLGALLMVDLDSFKLVNDLYGHKMGDNVLISFAEILRENVPEGSCIGRLGGDEFSVFISGLGNAEAVSVLTRTLNDKLIAKAKELMGEDMGIPLGVSVGGVFVPMHGDDYDELLRLADKALYIVKNNGKHSSSVYMADADPEEALQASVHNISRLSEILGERSVPNMALQLDKDSFAYVYRYIMRYIMRNQRSLYKVLFTLKAEDGVDELSYKEYCDMFGSHIRENLRKTDILMRNRFNQYFVILTDTREKDIDIVTGNLKKKWELSGGKGLDITYEKEFVSMDAASTTSGGDIRIALADDDDANLRLTGGILSKAGYHVSAVRSGQGLLKYLGEHSPDLILLDVQMPEMDGFETLRRIREIKGAEDIPVVFLTAEEDEETERRGMALGAEDFIRKPFVPELLIKRVKRIAELRRFRKNAR